MSHYQVTSTTANTMAWSTRAQNQTATIPIQWFAQGAQATDQTAQSWTASFDGLNLIAQTRITSDTSATQPIRLHFAWLPGETTNPWEFGGFTTVPQGTWEYAPLCEFVECEPKHFAEFIKRFESDPPFAERQIWANAYEGHLRTHGDISSPLDYFKNKRWRLKHDPALKGINKKANQLLRHLLSDTEFKALMVQDALEIPSEEDNTVFIVRRDASKRIQVKKDGVITGELCLVTNDIGHEIPLADILLTKIMLAKHDPKTLMKRANYFSTPELSSNVVVTPNEYV